MHQTKRILTVSLAAAGMLLLILNSKTAAAGAAAGIELCIRVIIPALFPFFVITAYLNASLLGISVPGLQFLSKRLHIPSGGESLLLLGLVGGYPVGAQLIGECYRSGQLDRRTGQILLGYCSNAGPAFIFGVAGALFPSFGICLVLWLIHLLSAVITGFLLPHPGQKQIRCDPTNGISLAVALEKSILVCARVCGWIIFFKAMSEYLGNISPFFSGLLELSSGCVQLTQLESLGLQFILCSVFLAFGGVCVLLQTMSVTGALGLGLYIPGKLVESAVSFLLSLPAAYILFSEIHLPLPVLLPPIVLSCIIISTVPKFFKKRYGNKECNPV